MGKMDYLDIDIEIDADKVVENPSERIKTKNPFSGESTEEDYFHFDLNCDRKSYSIRAKSKDTLPSILTIPRTHNELPVTLIADRGFSCCNELSILLFEEPSNIKTIGSHGFSECKNIESIVLPASIMHLDSRAFSYCSLLQQVYFRSKRPPRLGQFVFKGTSPFLDLYVPACSVCHYKGGAYWCEYRDLVLPSPENIPTNLGFFSFELNEGSYTIYAKAGVETPLYLAIPWCYNRKPVTVIGGYGFRQRQIIEVIIPDTIEEIGNYAFAITTTRSAPGYIYSESILERVIFGCKSHLARIGMVAFNGHLKLTNIELPEKVRVIEDGAFSSCGITAVNIPKNVETMGRDVFFMCLRLKRIAVDKHNPFYRDIDGIMYNKAANTLIAYPLGRENSLFTLPDTVTNFGNNRYWGCQNLMAIFLNSPKPPEMNADFTGMFPEPVLKIYVPDGSYDAYISADGWKQYAGIIYKRGIIENGFAIKDHVLIQYVENHAELTLPKEIEQISDFALAPCTALKKITVEEGNQNFRSVEGVLFSHDMTRLVRYPPAWEANEYEVPRTIQSIGTGAFFNCDNLSLVSVHKRLESLEGYAFFQCVNLSRLINLDARDNIKAIGYQAFLGCASIREVRLMAAEYVLQAAFSFCNSLTRMTFGPDIKEFRGMMMSVVFLEQVDLNIFALTPPLASGLNYANIKSIHIPAESIELYKATVPWSFYSGIIYPLFINLTNNVP